MMPRDERGSFLPRPGKLSRRTVLKGGAALATVPFSSFAPLVVPENTTLAANGTLVTGFYQVAPNPWAMDGNSTWTGLVFETLIAIDANYEAVIPALADSWDVSDDQAEYTFHLRQDVKWHDGTLFTSADVVFSYTTLLHPEMIGWLPDYLLLIKGAQSYKKGETTDLPGLTAPDPYTVKLVLEAPSPLLLQNLTTVWILPQHLLQNMSVENMSQEPYFVDQLVGLGPFKFQEHEEEEFITVVRNDDYYRGKPLLDTIIARRFDQDSVAILSQEAGEVDIIGLRSPDDVEHVQSNPDVVAFPGPSVNGQSFFVGKVPAILDDKRVRQALLYAIDREAIVQSLFKGTAHVINTPFVVPWVPIADVNPYTYDPEKAKLLLAEAGWDSGQELRIITDYADPFVGKVLAAIQQYLSDVGVAATIQQADSASLQKDTEEGNFSLRYDGHGVGPDPENSRIYFHSDSGLAWITGFRSDPDVDRLYGEGAILVDQAERAVIYEELALRLNDLAWWLPLWVPLRYWSVSKAVAGVEGKLGAPGYHRAFYAEAEKWQKTQ
jgi:peptide/nickel transport system substrate-binding protein